jgi:hypothetical protein
MIKSRSDAQLRGDASITDAETATCAPQRYDANGSLILPCGLAAWTLFNDSFAVYDPAGVTSTPLAFSSANTAFKWDRDKVFATQAAPHSFNTVPSLRGGGSLPAGTPLQRNENFVTWMRTPTLSSFYKLYARLDGVTLPAGAVLTVSIQNNWNSYGFAGKKFVKLSTSSWLGGANDFLGVAYIVTGSVCLVLAAFFELVLLLKGRKLGDPRLLSWNRR